MVTSVYFSGVMVRLMLVFAPAACIMSGIALSEAFSVFTRSIKLQLPKLVETLTSGAGDTNAERSIAQNDAVKVDKQLVANKSGDVSRDKPSKKNRKKDKETEKEKETVDKAPTKSRNEKRLLVLPLEASAVAILLLIVLGSFYVVHCVWAAAEAYSAPSIVLTSQSHDGFSCI